MASGDTLAIFTPHANQPPASNYATIGFRNGRIVLEFDDTTQEIAIFAGKMPRNYGGGGIYGVVSWMAKTATTGNGGWDVTLERCASGGDDMDADSWATAQTITALTVPASSGVIQVSSVLMAAGAAGTDSVAAGDDIRVRVRRDVASDNAVGDLQLLSVELMEA